MNISLNKAVQLWSLCGVLLLNQVYRATEEKCKFANSKLRDKSQNRKFA